MLLPCYARFNESLSEYYRNVKDSARAYTVYSLLLKIDLRLQSE